MKYPHILVSSQPKRLFDALNRIVAPTQSSLRGPSKLTGSSLQNYRHKLWVPRVTSYLPGPCQGMPSVLIVTRI